MSSELAWMDHSEEQRKRMLEVVALFRVRDTRDELGLGGLRDAFSAQLFPGTSTIQTRPRYFLLVPWVMLRLEGKRVPSSQAAARARDLEVGLIRSLTRDGEPRGVLGRDAGANLQRLPSAVYWGGLGSYGIRRAPGSINDYYRLLDGMYARRKTASVRAEGDEFYEGLDHAWDPNLPAPPDDLWDRATLDLHREEARYLSERIILSHPESLLAHMLQEPPSSLRADMAWQVSMSVTERLSEILYHAELVSLVMNGAALLYNLLLGRSAVELGLTGHASHVERHTRSLDHWSARMAERLGDLAEWDRVRLWGITESAGYQAPPHTRRFVEGWADHVIRTDAHVSDDPAAVAMITERERWVKGKAHRIGSLERLERWTGESGSSALNYRWPVARQMLWDIRAGLRRA